MKKSLKYGTATTLLIAMAVAPIYGETAYATGRKPSDLKPSDLLLSQAGMYGPDPAVYENKKDIQELLYGALPFLITVAGGVALITVEGVKLIRHKHRHHESKPEEKPVEFDEEPVEPNEAPAETSQSETSESEPLQPEDESVTQPRN